MKNTKTIAVAAIALLVILVGASMWMRNSQEGRVDPQQTVANLPGATPSPTLDIRAVMWDSKANTLMVEGKYVESAEMFRKSLEIQENPVIRYELGRALTKAGRKEEAIQAFKQVMQGQDAIMSKKAKKRIDDLERGVSGSKP